METNIKMDKLDEKSLKAMEAASAFYWKNKERIIKAVKEQQKMLSDILDEIRQGD